MRRYVSCVTAAGVLLATVAFAGAQQPAAAPDGHDAAHMAMCRQMMGQAGMMGGGMGAGMSRGMGQGMMGMGSMMDMGPMMGGDPRQQAEMMAMRGEMMKAMGDIMTKYAQRMQPAK